MFKRLLSVVLIFGLVGCSANTEGAGNGANVLEVGFNVQPETLDPHLSNTSATNDIARHIFEHLVAFDENNEVAPLLAESYEEAEDGKSITFHLRKGVKFHNGKEMTADDVVASMERWRSLSGKAIAFLSDSEFVKEDEYTVVLKMDKPMTIAKYIVAMSMTFAAIMPDEVIEESKEGTTVNEFIGTGPFEFVEWKQDQHVKLVKFEDYQSPSGETSGLVGKREALVDELTFHFVQDPSTRTAGIQSGEYDIAMSVPNDNVEQLKKDPNVKVNVETIGSLGFLTSIFNKKKGLFAEQKARQAVNLAVNKEDVMLSAYSGEDFFILNHGLVPETSKNWYSDAGIEEYNDYDPERAKQLLQEVGYNGEPIRIIATRDYEDHYNSGIVLQEQLQKIGMNVELEVYDWPTLLEKRTDENAYDIYMMSFLNPTDPTQIQYLDSRYNFPGWTDHPVFDELLDELAAAPTQEEAKEIFDAIQAESWEYLPIIKYGEYIRGQAMRKNISNFRFFHSPIFWNVEKE